MKALADVFGAQRRANRALFDDVHWRGQRACAQQQRQVVGFAHAHGAGNLEAVAQLALNDRRGQHLAFALFKQQNRHALFDVFAAGVAHDAPALGIDRQIDLGLLVLRIKAGLGVGQVFAGQDDLLLDDHRLAVALQKTLGAKRHWAAAAFGGSSFGAVFDQAHFQRRGAAQNVLGLGCVLHAGQLHDDTVNALLLDHRLGHAQLVDPVVQRQHVLLERLVLNAARGLGLDAGGQLELAAVGRLDHLQVGHLLLDQAFGRRQRRGIAKADFNRLAIAGNAAVAQVFVAQRQTDVTGERFGALGQRRLHIDLQHEMHAAAQIQPQIHRVGVQRFEPVRRARQQIERYDISRVARLGRQRLLNDIPGLALGVGVAKTRLDGAAFKRDGFGGNTGLRQGLLDLGQRGRVHLETGLAAGDLNGQ